MKYTKWILVTLILVMLLSLNPLVAYSQPVVPPIDIYTDLNGDGIPDDLLARFGTLAASEANAGAEAGTSAGSQAAIISFTNSLPYSHKTRMLQQEARQLQTQINKTTNVTTAMKLYDRMNVLQKQMMADPAYAKATTALERILVRDGLLPDRSQGISSAENTAAPPEAMSPDAIARMRDQESAAPGGVTASPVVHWEWLIPGDIVLEGGGLDPWPQYVVKNIYAYRFQHAGTWAGEGFVYEANRPGTRRVPISDWKVRGRFIGLGYNKTAWWQFHWAMKWAYNKYGDRNETPYNIFYWNKWTNKRLYCSQLVWKLNMYFGTNLDSNYWPYIAWLSAKWGGWVVAAIAIPAVLPDELYFSKKAAWFSAGTY